MSSRSQRTETVKISHAKPAAVAPDEGTACAAVSVLPKGEPPDREILLHLVRSRFPMAAKLLLSNSGATDQSHAQSLLLAAEGGMDETFLLVLEKSGTDISSWAQEAACRIAFGEASKGIPPDGSQTWKSLLSLGFVPDEIFRKSVGSLVAKAGRTGTPPDPSFFETLCKYGFDTPSETCDSGRSLAEETVLLFDRSSQRGATQCLRALANLDGCDLSGAIVAATLRRMPDTALFLARKSGNGISPSATGRAVEKMLECSIGSEAKDREKWKKVIAETSKKGADPGKSQAEYLGSPFFSALESGATPDDAAFLLSLCKEPLPKGPNGASPFAAASCRDTVSFLAQRGFDTMEPDSRGDTPFEQVCERLSSLPSLSYGTDFSKRVEAPSVGAIEEALSGPFRDMLDAADERGDTVLIRMAKEGEIDSCIVLLRAGANPCHINGQGKTFLDYASTWLRRKTKDRSSRCLLGPSGGDMTVSEAAAIMVAASGESWPAESRRKSPAERFLSDNKDLVASFGEAFSSLLESSVLSICARRKTKNDKTAPQSPKGL